MITVQDVLQQALPATTRVIAGTDHLGREVTWATRLRSAPPGFEHLSGGEVVLLPPRVLEELDERLTLADAIEQLATFQVAAVAVTSNPGARARAVANAAGIPLLVLPRSTDLSSLERQTARFITDQRRAIQHRGQEVTRKLMELAIAGEPLDEQVATLADLAHRTVVVESRDGRLLASHTPHGDPVSPEVHQLVRQTRDSIGPWLRSVATTSAAEPATAIFEGANGWRRVVAPVVGRDGLLGSLSLIVDNETGTAADQILTARGAAACAVTLARDQAAAYARREVELNVLDEILDGALRSEVSLAQQLKRLGHDIEQPHVALIVRAQGEDGVSRARAGRWSMLEEGISRAASRFGTKSLWRARGSSAEIVWPVSDPTEASQVASALHAEIRDALARHGVQETVSVGVGRVGSGFDAVRQSHQEARQALMLGRRVRGSGQVTLFDDLGVYRLIYAAEHLPELQGFMAESLGPLMAYDQQHGADLVRTLEAFFEANCSPKETAALLHVHRNTVLYRLDRIASILQADLNDPTIRLRLHLALHVRLALTA
ncbi:MAG TPA: helix-turn-helix domain-containing protein [Thermomicrobiales bacterium]|nr:helix-turn-helix domain-containing protein [Thermomicrobiales bacterium]